MFGWFKRKEQEPDEVFDIDRDLKTFIMDIVNNTYYYKYSSSAAFKVSKCIFGQRENDVVGLELGDCFALPSPWFYHQCYLYALRMGWLEKEDNCGKV